MRKRLLLLPILLLTALLAACGTGPEREPVSPPSPSAWESGTASRPAEESLSESSASRPSPESAPDVEEGQLRLEEYFRVLRPDGLRAYEYLGETDWEVLGLEKSGSALHYSIREKNGDGPHALFDVYIDRYPYVPYFYTRTEDGLWKKCMAAAWEGETGERWTYAFCQPFSLGEGVFTQTSELEMTVRKNGIPQETYTFPLASDWITARGGIDVDDINFDGCPDIGIAVSPPANWGGRATRLYLRQETRGAVSYSYLDTLTGFPLPCPEKKLLYGYARGSATLHCFYAYEYRDGRLVQVASLDEEWMPDPDTGEESLQYTVTREDGTAATYPNELPPEWEEFWAGRREG